MEWLDHRIAQSEAPAVSQYAQSRPLHPRFHLAARHTRVDCPESSGILLHAPVFTTRNGSRRSVLSQSAESSYLPCFQCGPFSYAFPASLPSLRWHTDVISEVAVSMNNNEVRIYARQGNDWNHIDTLTEVRVQRCYRPYLTTTDCLPLNSTTSPSPP